MAQRALRTLTRRCNRWASISRALEGFGVLQRKRGGLGSGEGSGREERRVHLLEGGRSIGPDAFLSAGDTREASGVTRALGCVGRRGGEFALLSSRGSGSGPGPGRHKGAARTFSSPTVFT